MNNRIGEPIDRKFTIMARSIESGNIYTDFDGVLFLAKDNAFPATLRFYREECVRQGCAPEQLRGIDLLIERVDRYRASNPEKLKIADIDPEKGASIIAPNKE
jgi:hypothetical protein